MPSEMASPVTAARGRPHAHLPPGLARLLHGSAIVRSGARGAHPPLDGGAAIACVAPAGGTVSGLPVIQEQLGGEQGAAFQGFCHGPSFLLQRQGINIVASHIAEQ
jgi:hypothetical protein